MQVDDFSLLLMDIQRGGIMGSTALLRALQEYFKELDVSELKVWGVECERQGIIEAGHGAGDLKCS